MTYAYDSANRLIAVSGQPSAFSFGYNGFGDGVAQTVNGVTTAYTLDLNAGLTQVLSDGADVLYLYGNERVAQYTNGTLSYFLGDALGSVRQLADVSGNVTLAKSYQPYGSVMSSAGSGASAYGYTGEQQSSGLVYLRARFYTSGVGRFLSRDSWRGDSQRPMSYNVWLYTEGNPINATDPSGYCKGTKPFNQVSFSTHLAEDALCWFLVAEIEKELGGSNNDKLQGMNVAWNWQSELDATKLLRITKLIGVKGLGTSPALGTKLTTADVHGEARLWLVGSYGRSLALKNQSGQIDAVEALARWATFTADFVQHELNLGERQAFADLMLLGTSHIYEPGMLQPELVTSVAQAVGPAFNDSGFHFWYQDGDDQVHHSIIYMTWAAIVPPWQAPLVNGGNFYHETFDPNAQGGGRSFQDFVLGQRAAQLGVVMRLTPSSTWYGTINFMLRTADATVYYPGVFPVLGLRCK